MTRTRRHLNTPTGADYVQLGGGGGATTSTFAEKSSLSTCVVGRVGIEPTTKRLRVSCSTS